MNEQNFTQQQVALVTGANQGIGYEVARKLAEAGVAVYLGARDSARGEAAAKTLLAEGLDVRFLLLDLLRPETVVAAASVVGETFERLDVLVNNAGINDPDDGPPGEADLDALRRVFETNFFGTVVVTQIMLPLIRNSASGRIVNVSSGLGSLTAVSSGPSSLGDLFAYSSSKAALNMFTIQLARELKDAGILVNSAAPGYTATALNDFKGTQSVEEGARIVVKLALLADDGPTGGFFDMNGTKPW